MDVNRTITDVFDFFASKVGDMWQKDSEPLPDMSSYDISHLITDEDVSSPERFYARTDVVPKIKVTRKTPLPGLDIIEGEFPSVVNSPFPENNTVYAIHFRLRGAKKNRPVVVMINGLHVDTNFYFDWWCWRFAAWGMDSVIINNPYSIKRTPAGSFSGQYLIVPDTMWTLLSIRQTYLDVQTLVNWLVGEGFGKIGTFGVSYGGLMSGIYVCQDDNADFCILGMPPVDFMETLSVWDFADELREKEKAGQTTMLSDPRVPRLVNINEMKPRTPLSNIFIGMGKYDHLVTPESFERTEEAWGTLPWLKKYPTGHINTFVFNQRFINDARKFVKEEIV